MVVGLCVSVAACASDRITTAAPDVAVLTPHVWSGGVILVRAAPRYGLPPIVLGGDTVVPARADSFTLAVAVPVGPARALDLAVLVPGAHHLYSRVQVHGLEGTAPAPPLRAAQGEQPLAAPDGSTRIAAYGTGGVVLFDARTPSAVLPFPAAGDRRCLRFGPGRALSGAAMTLAPFDTATVWRCGPLEAWIVHATGHAVLADTGPSQLDRDFLLAALYLAPGRWLLSSGGLQLYTRRADGGFDVEALGRGPIGFAVTSGGRRVVPLRWSDAGPAFPVIDAEAGGVAGVLPGPMPEAAAFSPDGDTLFALDVTGLRVYDLASWRALDSVAVTSAAVPDLVADPVGPWLYLLRRDASGVVVEVLDRGRLRVAGRLGPAPEGVLAVSPAERRLYVVGSGAGGASVVARFSLPPAP